MTDQIRRSSRSVCTNLAEAWRKRRYEAAFISKLSDSEAEAAETQTWLEFAVKCGYLDREQAILLYKTYEEVLATIVGMINHPETWVIRKD
jgi:four helix bundle protein